MRFEPPSSFLSEKRTLPDTLTVKLAVESELVVVTVLPSFAQELPLSVDE